MKLPSRINYNFATLSGVTLQPNEDGGKAILVINAPLTPELAGSMGIREQFYEANGVSREFTGSLHLVCEPLDTQIKIKSDSGEFVWNPEKIKAFEVTREKVEDGTQLLMTFRVHLATADAVEQAFMFARAVNKDCFGCALVAKQQEFPFVASEDEKQEVAGCKLCDADVALNEDGTEHITSDGELVPCLHPSAATVNGKGVLASKAEMGRIQGTAANAVEEIRTARGKRLQ